MLKLSPIICPADAGEITRNDLKMSALVGVVVRIILELQLVIWLYCTVKDRGALTR